MQFCLCIAKNLSLQSHRMFKITFKWFQDCIILIIKFYFESIVKNVRYYYIYNIFMYNNLNIY